ncbi:MAG: hypothetical protein ACE5F1_15150, partial [Planctomycetota bacterium]
MIAHHEVFLEALDHGKVPRKEFFRELSAAGDEGEIEEVLEASESLEDAGAYDVPRLRGAVESDLELLRELQAAAGRVEAGRDPKLAALVDELARIAEEARHQPVDGEDERQKRKV